MAISPSIRMGRSEFIRLTEAALRAGFGLPNATAMAVEVQAEADRRFGTLKELADADDADQAERLDKGASTLASGVKKFVHELTDAFGADVLSKVFDGIPTTRAPDGTQGVVANENQERDESNADPNADDAAPKRAPQDERLSALAGMAKVRR